MSKKYYKLLTTGTNKSYASPMSVKYTLGEWTYAPEGTLLFVYTTNEKLKNTNMPQPFLLLKHKFLSQNKHY